MPTQSLLTVALATSMLAWSGTHLVLAQIPILNADAVLSLNHGGVQSETSALGQAPFEPDEDAVAPQDQEFAPVDPTHTPTPMIVPIIIIEVASEDIEILTPETVTPTPESTLEPSATSVPPETPTATFVPDDEAPTVTVPTAATEPITSPTATPESPEPPNGNGIDLRLYVAGGALVVFSVSLCYVLLKRFFGN